MPSVKSPGGFFMQVRPRPTSFSLSHFNNSQRIKVVPSLLDLRATISSTAAAAACNGSPQDKARAQSVTDGKGVLEERAAEEKEVIVFTDIATHRVLILESIAQQPGSCD